MEMKILKSITCFFFIVFLACMNAQAQSDKPIRIVVPFAAGGPTDVLARVLAPKLSASLKRTVIVDNRVGATGGIGANYVAKAAPDGDTLLLGTSSIMAASPNLTLNLPYDTVNDFVPISLVATIENILVVHPSVSAKSVKELIAYAKANPGKLHFGSSGIGAASHLSGELFKAQAKVDMQHVPYKGTGQALTDLLAGQIELMFAPTQTVIPQLSSGRLKAIAVTGTQPLEALPQLPTVAASGLPGYQAQGWFGLLAPKATPPAVIAKLHDDVARVLAMPEVKKDLVAKGAEPGTGTAAEFGRFIADEQAKWARLVKDAGIVLE